MDFKKIDINNYTFNPFTKISKEWLLVTAEKEGVANTLTASWGGVGHIWNKNVVYIFIRESRYTKEFLDSSDTFSLTFFDDKYKTDLSYLGTVSGRDEKKIEKVGFNVSHIDNTPYFDEAKEVFICKKLSKHFIAKDGMIDETIVPKCYSNNDYHYMYVGEIIDIYTK
ncbi:MAG: flavin reductase [Lachnospirales bacterium]